LSDLSLIDPIFLRIALKYLQYYIEYLLLKSFLLFVRIIPEYFINKFSTLFGYFLYYLGVRKKVVDINLNIAFGDQLSFQQLTELRKNVYLNAANVLFEFLCMNHIKTDKLDQYITISGQDVLKDALKEGKGVVVAGNHFGHWELATAAISYFCEPLYIFTGMQKNKRVDDVMNKIRGRFGTVTISKAKTAPFEMIKALKKNKPLGMAGDLNVPHNNLFVDFFSKKAVVGQGLASYTINRKAPLVFIWSVRVAPFKYKGFIKRLYYQVSGDTEIDQKHVAQLISSELEDKIRSNPDQYFWFNRRWKTRPAHENEGEIY